MSKHERLTLISLCAGAGGLDIGLEAAGFEIALAVERDPVCCETLRANHRWPVLEADLQNLTPQEILVAAGLKRGEPDLLAAGPPCQPFSKSANWTPNGARGLEDPRSAVLLTLFDLIEYALPRCVLIENVEGFRGTNEEGGLGFVLRRFAAINRRQRTNYNVSWRILNAAEHGVPQLRKRFFLTAFRDGGEFGFPQASRDSEYVTCWQAIGLHPSRIRGDLAVKGRWGQLLPSVPEGKNYLWHTNRGGGLPLFGWRTRYWSFLLKLAKSGPAWTISAHPAQNAGPFHWTNRQLTTNEMLRLQTFPTSIFIAGSRADRQRQIGNAVPCLLAEAVGRAIITELTGRRFRSALKLSVPCLTGRIPKPEVISEPASQYLQMAGRHSDHPGTGRGPRPRAVSMAAAPAESL